MMADNNEGDSSQKSQHPQSKSQLSSSPNDPLEESTEIRQPHQNPPPIVVTGAPFISPPLYVEQIVNPKRPRFDAGQWKLLPSPTTQPTIHVSSPETTSSPSHSSKGVEQFHQQHQFRKGKYVSPVWKPHEMLWLARAWRVQYQDGSNESGSNDPKTRGKTRADKDREVAEFLNNHGVNRDAKTAGTKWDNMLGEFRKVYEWERGGERDQIGKSYFRLSPYERKVHRLPASFDEEVFEELSQFMGSRMRTSPQTRGTSGSILSSDDDTRALPPPPSKDDQVPPFPYARTKQLVMASGGEGNVHGNRPNFMGFESPLEIAIPSTISGNSREMRRIGKIRMTWEESVSLWAEEGESYRGRIKLKDSSFLNADELTFFDDSTVASSMEAFEDGVFKGFSVDRFVSGQQIKVFGRKKATNSSGFTSRFHLPLTEPSLRPYTPFEYQDPTEFYVGCLRLPPTTLPTMFDLSWYIQEPPPEELRFPLRRDVYKDLPQGKELFFTTSTELLDCRAITLDILSPIIRPNPSISASTASSRDSFIGLWDDCINRIVSRFCPVEMTIIRKKPSSSSSELLTDEWPNVTGFVRNFCLWRGEETDRIKDGELDPASSIVEKLLWTYTDLPYILGYYAIGYIVTFCALSRSQDRIIRSDLYSLDLSSSSERLKALVPCYRFSGLLPLLADRCFNNVGNLHCKIIPYSDYERIDLGHGNIVEMTPITVTRYFSSRKKWAAVKEIYDILDQRIPHAEFIFRSSEKEMSLVLKPRGCKIKPKNCDQLVEALKCVTKSLVALHDISFMHRDLCWEKVMKRNDRDSEWVLCGFDEAMDSPQIYPHTAGVTAARGQYAPEMGRGLHGVKVDVWGVGNLVRSCGLVGVPKMLRELQNRCLDQNPEQRPTAAECYHHLSQMQSSLSATAAGGGVGGY